MTEKQQHHQNSPSTLGRRNICPASRQREEDLPPRESPEALEGSAWHAVAREVHRPEIWPTILKPFDMEVTSEIESAMEWLRKELENDFGACDKVAVEKHGEFYSEGKLVTAGTVDRMGFNSEAGELIIADYKAGWLCLDMLMISPQLMGYAAIWAAATGVEIEKVRGIAYQLRHRNRIEVEMPPVSVVREEIITIVDRTFEPDAPACPSLEGCYHCNALGVNCPDAAKESMLEIAKMSTRVPKIKEDFEALAEVIQRGKRWVLKAEEFLKDKLLAGMLLDAVELRDKKGKRKLKGIETCSDKAQDVMELEEFFDLLSIPIGAFEKLYAEKWAAKQKAQGLKGTIKGGKAQFAHAFGDLFLVGEPTKFLFYKKEAESE